MKGQNPLLSHVFAIAFLVALVIAVMQITSTLKGDYQSFIAEQEVQQVCSIIKSSVAKLNHNNNYLSVNDTTKGRIYFNLPNRIADLNYIIRFIEKNASIELRSANTTCSLGYNATFLGRTAGGRTKIEMKELSSGALIVEMTRG